MNLYEMVIGNTYQLTHGKGVLVGFEEFYDADKKSKVSLTVPENQNPRAVFKLEPSHTWAFTDQLYFDWVQYVKSPN